ncbi:TonB-dependent receptor plug domain-containing protein [Steroidobacter sp.]|uniref:TonB-dependent receptor plug domain-containing protein n=1 Tax=Steroidobacter sp. TaxID=1978227 RepID=UPI001A620364|nr:TonB-dependent receptor [Steroidobacter sp.]MBL8266356.1 TonB-dependent receptor [Steroidobacter sp.]
MEAQSLPSLAGRPAFAALNLSSPLRLAVIAALGLNVSIASAQQAPPSTAELEEVLVTGTLIRGAPPTGSDLVTVSRDVIEASGVTTTAELLATVPQITSFNTTPVGTSDFSQPITAPNLRGIGLGSTATLVLVNGHRMVGAGILQTIPDPSAIPTSAIERVEIIADGASATYGSDAVGGVINLITRKDFDGFETTAQYGYGDGFDTMDFNTVFGTAWETGSVMFAYEYTGRNNLQGRERDFIRSNLASAGGADSRSTVCSPANITYNNVSYTGSPLTPGLSRCDNTQYTDYLSAEHRNSAYVSLTQGLGDNVEFFSELYYSQRKSNPINAQPGATFAIPITNPYFSAPAGGGFALFEVVQYSFAREFGPTVENPQELTAGGLVSGVRVSLPAQWQMELLGNYGVGTNETTDHSSLNSAALNAAAAGLTLDTALDPFAGRTNPAVLAAIRSGGTYNDADQELREVSLKFDGPLFSLPGGQVRMAVGAQYHYEEIEAKTFYLQPNNQRQLVAPSYGDRTVRSAFAELSVPLVGSNNAFPGVKALQLSLSGRYDDYSDFGDTTNPKFGVNWTLVDGFSLRASSGKSFHAPSLADSNVSTVDSRLQIVPFFPFFPPGALPGPAVVIAGGQPNLKPETADTWSVGFDFNPSSLDNLNVSAALYNVDFEDVLGIPFWTIGLFTNPALAQYYTYRPTASQLDALLNSGIRIDGTLTPALRAAIIAGGEILDLRRRNLARQEVQGVDFNINYRWDTSAGIFFAGVAGQRELKFDLTAAPGAATVDQTDRGRVKWRARGTLNWIREQWSVGGFINYTGKYTNPNLLTQEVDSFVTVDAHVTYTPRTGGWLAGTQISLLADNVLDEEPPLYLSSPGFDSANSSALGRVVSINLRKSW